MGRNWHTRITEPAPLAAFGATTVATKPITATTYPSWLAGVPELPELPEEEALAMRMGRKRSPSLRLWQTAHGQARITGAIPYVIGAIRDAPRCLSLK